MTIFERGKGNGTALCIPSDQNGDFPNEWHVFLQNGTGNPDLFPGLDGIGFWIEGKLPFSVVAKSGGFETGFSGKSF